MMPPWIAILMAVSSLGVGISIGIDHADYKRIKHLMEDAVRSNIVAMYTTGALAILDRWQRHMDEPEAMGPLEIHHEDIATLRGALRWRTAKGDVDG